jgi:hypothetical protein
MSMRLAGHLLVAPALLFALLAARCGSDSADAAPASGSAAAAASPGGPKILAAKFCPALLPKVKAFVKVPLDSIKLAQDETNDDLHAGDDGYVSCTFSHAQEGYVITTGMHAGDVSRFVGTTEQGFTNLPGFGDHARAYDASLRWVDVVKGSVACETIVTMADGSLTESDWKQAGGKICNAAFELYR